MDEYDDAWSEGRHIARRYTLERRLGGGSAGDVWLAEDRLLKKAVALKVLHHELAKSRDTVRRFLREVALAHSVTHPNVVRIYDTGEEDGMPFFTMEYLQGQTLEELLDANVEQQNAPMPFEEVREIALDVLDAMRAAHRVGVVHRDLKPGNVMLTHRGAIVMDFGVAGVEELPERPNAAQARSLVRTEAGTIFGSPAYMAPELWEGAQATVQSDLYAFGVMLYQMLTGRLPYRAKTPAGYLQQLSAGPPTPLRSLRRDTPWSMVRLVRRCMARNPENRPATATAAANSVSPLRGKNRKRLAVGAATVVVVGAVSGLFKSTPSWKRLGLPDQLAEHELSAAVRSHDVGDSAAAHRRLDRLARQSPKSAALAFWRAALAAELRDEDARQTACADADELEGDDAWKELASAACGPTFAVPAKALAAYEDEVDAPYDQLLPLAVQHDLLPRLEASTEGDPIRSVAREVLDQLGEEPPKPTAWTMSTRREVVAFDLELALGRTAEATEHLDALLEGESPAPIVTHRASWLALSTGDMQRATTLAEQVRHVDPRPWFDLRLREGQLEKMRQRMEDVDPQHRAAVRQIWCGYAWRFAVRPRPAECVDLPPSLAAALWAAPDAPPIPLASPLEDLIAQSQRDRSLGTCGAQKVGPSPLTHAPPPFSTRRAELAVEAALCDNDPPHADLDLAQTLAGNLLKVSSAPWAKLLHAQVDEVRRQQEQAQTLRLQVEEAWSGADDDLPAVRSLRQALHGAPAITQR